jgi:hypothetical protein
MENIMEQQTNLFSVGNAEQTGAQLRDAGIEMAVDHAESEAPGWAGLAYDFILAYARGKKWITCEEVRQAAAEMHAVPEPPDSRAWGGPMRRAAKAGYLHKTNMFKHHEDPKCHAGMAAMWEVAIW